MATPSLFFEEEDLTSTELISDREEEEEEEEELRLCEECQMELSPPSPGPWCDECAAALTALADVQREASSASALNGAANQ